MPEILTESLFTEFSALLILAGAIGFAGHLLKQPLVVSYILVGIIAGPAVLGIAQSEGPLELLADLGIAVLLFLVGLKLDYRLIRSLGLVSLTTGLGQVLFTSGFGFLIALALGFDTVASLYIAVALTFSSTIIIVKLLSDKRELDSLHGKVALGFLIVQDIIVVLSMVVLSTVGVGAAAEGEGMSVTGALTAGAILIAVVILIIRFAADPVTRLLAESQELLILFSLGLAALFAALGEYLGLGLEIGGLLAGAALASTPYRDSIASRLATLRDFLLLFFFLVLGTQLELDVLGANIGAALIFSAFVLIGNPLIVLTIMGLLGYRQRTGFLAGLTVAQISEFSLIFIGMGVTLGHVTESELGLVTLVGLITIAASTYMITYSHKLYPIFEPYLGLFEKADPKQEKQEERDREREDEPAEAILFGLGEPGERIAELLGQRGIRWLGVDHDPATVEAWQERGVEAIYGDVSDPEYLIGLPLTSAKWIISTLKDHGPNLNEPDPRQTLLKVLAMEDYQGKLAMTAYDRTEIALFEKAGADVILDPFGAIAADVVDRIVQGAGEEAEDKAKRPGPQPLPA